MKLKELNNKIPYFLVWGAVVSGIVGFCYLDISKLSFRMFVLACVWKLFLTDTEDDKSKKPWKK